VRMLEVSLTTTDALAVLERVAGRLGEDVVVGAGTVLTAEDAVRAREAGAVFAVTPALGDGVDTAVAHGMPVLAGAMTPSETVAAVRAGAAAVKLFPAGQLGAGYLKALRDPFPSTPFVPVGGVG